jgi:alanine racemase
MAFHMQFYRHTSAHIDLDHLAHNIRVLRSGMGASNFFCPMVKANAYGHGDLDVARRLEAEHVTSMGVNLIEEGVALRQMGIRADLLVFAVFDMEGAIEILRQRLTPVISTWSQLEIFEKLISGAVNLTTLGRGAQDPIELHLKFDTGMRRHGFDWLEAKKLATYFQDNKKHFKLKGICTHLHSGEDAQMAGGRSHEQLRRFMDIENQFTRLNPVSHTLNSSGLLNFISMRKEGTGLPGISLNQGARPGLAIYGYSPLSKNTSSLDLKPVMSLRSRVVRYHQLKAGDGVSYGHSWIANRKSIVGVVPIGYGDGYHRILSNKASVLFAGERVPVVGNICMDNLLVDLTDVFTAQAASFQSWTEHADQKEAEVTLFGYDSQGNILPATELAEQASTIAWEILTSVGERVPRMTVDDISLQMNLKNEVRT